MNKKLRNYTSYRTSKRNFSFLEKELGKVLKAFVIDNRYEYFIFTEKNQYQVFTEFNKDGSGIFTWTAWKLELENYGIAIKNNKIIEC